MWVIFDFVGIDCKVGLRIEVLSILCSVISMPAQGYFLGLLERGPVGAEEQDAFCLAQ